jgi:hypothetical protein
MSSPIPVDEEVGVTNGIWQGDVGHTKEAAYEGD